MKLITWSLTSLALIALFSFTKPVSTIPLKQNANPKIQVAILLDVSGSMDGLLEQAKSQLWNMVITLGKAQCADKATPQVELALYEYGRTLETQGKGYVKQLSPFTTDLDEVSKILFSLTTRGGDEYCGQVIHTSIEELNWDASAENYKVIFIAGNEDFLQGNVHYTKACDKAKEKGVIVNTIYCGLYEQGIEEHWNLLGECGNGSFMNINQNAIEEDIPTPFDSTLIVLNGKLNKTYIGYGIQATEKISTQGFVDMLNTNAGSNVAAKRIEAKAKSNVYNNATWDMVDRYSTDKDSTGKLMLRDYKHTLPDSLKNKTESQLQQMIAEKSAERGNIQKQIIETSNYRKQYIAEQKAKAISNEPTLESEVEKIIRQQVKRFNMVIQ